LLLPYAGKEFQRAKPDALQIEKEQEDLLSQLESMVTIRHVEQHTNEILMPETSRIYS
jgi:hypothetical protein